MDPPVGEIVPSVVDIRRQERDMDSVPVVVDCRVVAEVDIDQSVMDIERAGVHMVLDSADTLQAAVVARH